MLNPPRVVAGLVTQLAEKPKPEQVAGDDWETGDPANPYLGSMGIYLFKREALERLLADVHFGYVRCCPAAGWRPLYPRSIERHTEPSSTTVPEGSVHCNAREEPEREDRGLSTVCTLQPAQQSRCTLFGAALGGLCREVWRRVGSGWVGSNLLRVHESDYNIISDG